MASMTESDLIAELDAAAIRCLTPCGDGQMVWRGWGEGRPLVLLHGAHGSWMHWIRNIRALARRRRVWAGDSPGYGDSALPPAVDRPEDFAAVIADGIARLPGVDGPVDILAFSLGGVFATHVAALAPERVARLIIVDAGGLNTPLGQVRSTPVRGLTGDALAAAHRFNLLGLMLHNEDSVDDLALRVQAINVPKGRASPRNLVVPDHMLRVLDKVRAPIDLIWGEHDIPHPDPHAQLAVVRRYQPEATLRVIKDAGHWPMYERPEAFDAAVMEMLDLGPHR